MALVGDMISDAKHGNPSIVNYDMFAAVIGMLSLFYLIAVAVKENLAIHPLFPLIVDLLNTLFFFCGAVATAAKLGVHSCSNKVCIHKLNMRNVHRTKTNCTAALSQDESYHERRSEYESTLP